MDYQPIFTRDENLKLRQIHIPKANELFFSKEPLRIVQASGQYMYDDTGKRYLDCINNVCHVGHCNPHVVAAGHRQMVLLNTNNRFIHDEIVKLASRISALLPDRLNVVFFVCTGTEANDLALRLARTFTKHHDAVVLDGAYHGHSNTVHELSPYKIKKMVEWKYADWVHVVPIPDTYRGLHRGNRGDPSLGNAYAEEVRTVVEKAQLSGRKIAAFYAESLMSCAGQIIHPPGFLQHVYDIVHKAGGVCIADEVQVGFGRVGSSFWAFQHHGVMPDIVTMGKPIGNGHPISAVVTTKEIADAFEAAGNFYFNTFGGNPVSCAIANAVLDVIETSGLQQRALELGKTWLTRLEILQEQSSILGDVRGLGLFIGIEVVCNKQSREPAPQLASDILYRMKQEGILLSVDGMDENVLKIKPPLVITEEDVDFFMNTFRVVLQDFDLVLRSTSS